MNLRQIQELIKFVAKSGATEVDIEIGDVKLSIKSPPKGKITNVGMDNVSIPQQIMPVPPQVVPPQVVPPVVQQQPSIQTQVVDNANIQATTSVSLDDDKNNKVKTDDNLNYVSVKAPIIGTFYRRSSPDKDPFVNVGDKIEKGQTLCIIEAMKLFNEIESEVSGTIVKVLVDDMSPVEYDQPLFLIDPS